MNRDARRLLGLLRSGVKFADVPSRMGSSSQAVRDLASNLLQDPSHVPDNLVPKLFALYAHNDLAKWRGLKTAKIEHVRFGEAVVSEVYVFDGQFYLRVFGPTSLFPRVVLARDLWTKHVTKVTLVSRLSDEERGDRRLAEVEPLFFYEFERNAPADVHHFFDYLSVADEGYERHVWTQEVTRLRQGFATVSETLAYYVGSSIAHGFAIAVVPALPGASHGAALQDLARRLRGSGRLGLEHCLELDVIAWQQQSVETDSKERFFKSLRLCPDCADQVKDRAVLLLDLLIPPDTGLRACQQFLLDVGATLVQCAAVARRVE